MVEADILQALNSHLELFATNNSIDVAYPNVAFEDRPARYLAVSFLPNETQTYSVGSGKNQNRGLYQVSVFWPPAVGLIKPLELVSGLVGHFAKGTVLFLNDTKISIYRKPWPSTSLQEANYVQIPVTIPYESFN